MHCFRVSVAGVLLALLAGAGRGRVRRPALGLLPTETAEQRELPRFQVTRCPCCCKTLRSKIPLRCENLDSELRQAVDVVEVRVAAPVRVWAVLLTGCS